MGLFHLFSIGLIKFSYWAIGILFSYWMEYVVLASFSPFLDEFFNAENVRNTIGPLKNSSKVKFNSEDETDHILLLF